MTSSIVAQHVRAAERAEERGEFAEARRLYAEAASQHTALVRARRELRRVLDEGLPRLHTLAQLATGDAREAGEALGDLWERAVLQPAGPDALLSLLVQVLGDSLGRNAELRLEVLDDLLRADESRSVDPAEPMIDGDLTRLPVLIGEVRRYCLGSVLLSLPPAVRLAFLLVDVLGSSPRAAAGMLGTSESGLVVRVQRARRRLEGYLGPRCVHLDAGNPCSCEGRLGRALDGGLVSLPRTLPPEPPRGPFASPTALYGALPFAPPDLATIVPDDTQDARYVVALWQRAGDDAQAQALAAELGVIVPGWLELHRTRSNRADLFGFFAERAARRGRLGWARALYARAAVHEEVLLALVPPAALLASFASSAAACWFKARNIVRLSALIRRLEPMDLPPALRAEIADMHATLVHLRRDAPSAADVRRHRLRTTIRRHAWRTFAWHREALVAHRRLHRQLRASRPCGPT